MSFPFSLENVKFRETAHIAFEDEYVTAYQSTDIVPKIYKSVKHPSRQERLGIRQAQGLLSHTIQQVGHGKDIC